MLALRYKYKADVVLWLGQSTFRQMVALACLCAFEEDAMHSTVPLTAHDLEIGLALLAVNYTYALEY